MEKAYPCTVWRDWRELCAFFSPFSLHLSIRFIGTVAHRAEASFFVTVILIFRGTVAPWSWWHSPHSSLDTLENSTLRRRWGISLWVFSVFIEDSDPAKTHKLFRLWKLEGERERERKIVGVYYGASPVDPEERVARIFQQIRLIPSNSQISNALATAITTSSFLPSVWSSFPIGENGGRIFDGEFLLKVFIVWCSTFFVGFNPGWK